MSVDDSTATGKPSDTTRGGDLYARMKSDILSNAFPPGVQLSESELAARLGTSRTPVREAIIRLEAEGLVEVIPRRGVRVLPVQASDMSEIYDILQAVEPLAAEQVAARRPPPSELAELNAAAMEMESALEAEDLDRWAQGDDRFHREMLRLHGNRRLMAITSSLFNQAHRAQMVTLRMRGPLHRSNREHRAILESLANGDPAQTAALYRAHRQRGGQEMLDILENYGLPPL